LRQAIEIVSVASVQEALPVIFAAPRHSKPEPPARSLSAASIATLMPTASNYTKLDEKWIFKRKPCN
jgi:hypothetical protein